MTRSSAAPGSLARFAGVFIFAFAVVFPISAETGGQAGNPETKAVGTPPQLIQANAKQLGREAKQIGDEVPSAVWRGRDEPRLGIVDGPAFRNILDRIERLTVECDRQIAAAKERGRSGGEKDASACHDNLRKIRNQAFSLRANATRIWAPGSSGRYSYLVDVRRLKALSAELVRLARQCAETEKAGYGCSHPVPEPGATKTARVNTAIIW